MNPTKQSWLLNQAIANADLPVLPFIIAGGAVTSVFSGSQINDLDLWFASPDEFAAYRKAIEKPNVIPAAETDSAVSYSVKGHRIQLIKRLFGSPEEIIDAFDFTICMGAFVPATGLFVLADEFLYDLASRTLRYKVGKYPIASLWRVKKFLARGFNFPAIEAIKLALAINAIKIETYKDLKEQLEGIDTLFLKELTDLMLDKKGDVFELDKAIAFMEDCLNRKFNLEAP